MYGVRFIDDHELPEGHAFVMVRTPDDVIFFVKESSVTPEVLERGWGAYRELLKDGNIPEQRAGGCGLVADVCLQSRESLASAG